MGIIDRVTSAFEHPENWLEFECGDCETVFRIERGDDRTCPACGSTDVTFIDSA